MARRAVICRQSGVAIISVMLLLSLATLVVGTLFWQQHVLIRSVQNRLALAQIRWIESAVLDWAAVVLRVDRRNGPVDHLLEPWATPIAETRLDETVTAGGRLSDASRAALLTGQVFDAQARFNLNNLVRDGRISVPDYEAYQRLLSLLNLPQSLADPLAQRLLLAYPPVPTSGQQGQQGQTGQRTDAVQGADGGRAESAGVPASEKADQSPRDGVAVTSGQGLRSVSLFRLDDLRSVPGYDAALIEILSPFVVFLPKQLPGPSGFSPVPPTTVNINTAPAEVISAILEDVPLDRARRFVDVRERTFFASLEQAGSRFDVAVTLDPARISIGSSFFLVRGMIRFDRVESYIEALMHRGADRVDLLWRQKR
jgi:general secretion pathway protein K